MGRMTNSMKQLADDAERAAKAMRSAPQGSGYAPGSGGAVQITNNIVMGKTPIGTRGDDVQSRAFAYFGLSSANKSEVFIAQIVRAFEQMLAKGALSYRRQCTG